MCKKYVSPRHTSIKKHLSIKTINIFPESYRPGLYTIPKCSITKKEKLQFPNKGWIKPCYTKDCHIPTSLFIIINEKYKYYFCSDCQKYRKYTVILNNFNNIFYFESNKSNA